MGRSFTHREKERIRKRLLANARELFVRQGLKKTSLDELTRPAGIAKSSFYLFFDSKEALYLEVLRQDGPAIRERLQQQLDTANDARESIERTLTAIVAELETNALTRRMLTYPDELEQLAAAVDPEQLATSNDNGLSLLVPFLERGQARGEVIEGDAVLYARVVSAVTLLTLHRDKIGLGEYPKVMATLIELVAAALTNVPRRSRR